MTSIGDGGVNQGLANAPALNGANHGATDAGAVQRAALVRTLCDLVVLPANRISANERSLAADMILEVLARVDEDLRIDVARRVSRVRETPPALLRTLLLDEHPVAETLLGKAEFLPDALLAECARAGATAHRLAIARRLDLSPSVADAVLSFNETAVVKLLLRRDEFEFSPGAVDMLVARSSTDKEVQSLLLHRRELEPAHGFMMFWWVDSERRRRILSRFSISRALIQDALQDLYPLVFGDLLEAGERIDEIPPATAQEGGADPFVREILTILDRRSRPRGARGEPVSVDMLVRTLKAARLQPNQDVIHAASILTGLSRELVARILRDPGGEPFAVMGKSLGLPRDTFFEILYLKGADLPFTAEQAEDLMAVFDSLARDFARAVLRYWDWDGNPRMAQITRLIGLDADAPAE
ncbi:MAG: DUF2336 domain-containing protein [Pseudomonadota bacterium]